MPIYRALYDVENGGPPRAFECLLCDHALTDKVSYHNRSKGYGRTVLPTLHGMRIHLTKAHGFKWQENLFATGGNKREIVAYTGDKPSAWMDEKGKVTQVMRCRYCDSPLPSKGTPHFCTLAPGDEKGKIEP